MVKIRRFSIAIIFLATIIVGQIGIVNLLSPPLNQYNLILSSLILQIIFSNKKNKVLALTIILGLFLEIFTTTFPGAQIISLLSAIVAVDWCLDNILSKRSLRTTAIITILAIIIKLTAFYLYNYLSGQITGTEILIDKQLTVNLFWQITLTTLLTMLIYTLITKTDRRHNLHYINAASKNFYG